MDKKRRGIKLAPSILAADFSNLGRDVKFIEEIGAHYVHIDVMDGRFVPNITIGPSVIKGIRHVTDLIFDVHLMIEDAYRYLEVFSESGADIMTVHAEANHDLKAVIKKIKDLSKTPAIAISPQTEIEKIEQFLESVGMVLVMTVNPGFSGQKFMPEVLEKIKRLYKIKLEKGYDFDIEVDGGIDLNNVKKVIESGANVIVTGSGIYGASDKFAAGKKFIEILNEEYI